MAALNGEIPYDEEGHIIFPYIEKQHRGYKVHMNKGRSLPGIYSSYFQAELAMKKDIAVHNQKRKEK